MVHGADPDFPTLVTTSIGEADRNGVTGSIHWITPLANVVDGKPGYSGAGNQRPTYDNFLFSDPRNQFWWYISCVSQGCSTEATDPYFTGWPSMMVDNSAVQNRALGILSWLYDTNGLLYYLIDLHLSDPWHAPNQLYDFGGTGDGTLLYAGTPATIGGQTHIPIASVRLKMLRDGLEDYEYMKLVSDLGDPAFAEQTGRALFPHVYSARQPAAALDSTREALAQRILALKGSIPPSAPHVAVTAPPDKPTHHGR